MSIDYFSCAVCGKSFPDCSSYCRSCDGCGNWLCSDKCAKLLPVSEDNDNDEKDCCICRDEIASDSRLLECLLHHFNITKEQAIEIWQKEKDIS
jgi:hypothetical protein